MFAASAEVAAELGLRGANLDVLVNCAGVTMRKAVEEFSVGEYDRIQASSHHLLTVTAHAARRICLYGWNVRSVK